MAVDDCGPYSKGSARKITTTNQKAVARIQAAMTELIQRYAPLAPELL